LLTVDTNFGKRIGISADTVLSVPWDIALHCRARPYFAGPFVAQ